MRNSNSALAILLVIAFFVSGLTGSPEQDRHPSPASDSSLSTVLNPDGSLNVAARGSFDPRGFRMGYGPNGEPKFVSQKQLAGGGCPVDNWDTSFSINGTDDRVHAVVADGAGNVYVGGYFTAINDVAANGIAKWNGTSWSALGSGVSGQFARQGVSAIAVSGTDVYVGGDFTIAGGNPAHRIAKWNGSSWSAMGSGLGIAGNDYVEAIAVSGTNVYAGGHFNDGGGLNNIARWDGAAWQPLGTGMDNLVRSLAVSGTDVYAGGSFSNAGGVPANRIARWNGTSWSAMNSDAFGPIPAIAISGTDVYVVAAGGLRRWNGSSWDLIGGSINGGVNAFAVSGTDIYIGGSFTNAGGTAANRIAKWNGSQWTALGSGVGDNILDSVNGIAVSGGTVFVGGSFPSAGGVPTNNFATWNGSAWSGFAANGLNGEVRAIGVSGADVYVGGTFLGAGSVVANRIAKWNSITNTWSALGTGAASTGASVNAIAVSGKKVYVGGSFSSLGGVGVSNVAVWNGSSWAPLGSGVNGSVFAIAVRGEDVFVGGQFTNAGGQSVNGIAKWNGTSWSSLGTPVLPSSVNSLIVSGNDLYVGVTYTTVDGPNYFLKYDGTNWTSLGAGMTGGAVSSLAAVNGEIYVAGGFNAVGGVTAARIAKWNGSIWSALGGGIPGNTGGFDIGGVGNHVVAVGDFRTALGAPFNYIARWNGLVWSPMGGGINGTGSAITVAGGDVYVGGVFARAGCNSSPYFARWRETLWMGTTNTDWHNVANWGGGLVPAQGAGVTISANNATISSADVTLSSLVVANGRTLTVGSGRTLTVTGNLDLSGGTIAGPGTLVVGGELNLSGDISGTAAIVVNGSLNLAGGKISGPGPVTITRCSTGALTGGDSTSFVDSPLVRCINNSGTFRYPVGTGSVYSPVELANIFGPSNFGVEAKAGSYPNPAGGLPGSRLQRWWRLSNSGITSQADITFTYPETEVVGVESRYRVYSIDGGSAMQMPSTLNQAGNRATAVGVAPPLVAAWTLAEGIPAPRTMLGRVTNPGGRGAAAVLVSLVDDLGNTRYTMTNPFGYYRFHDVLTFKPYTVRVTSKKFTFSPSERLVEFDEFTTSVNFVSLDN
jgi:hypothetical protein